MKLLLSETIDCSITSSLVPQCPVCGGHMEVNLRKDNYFVQDSKWYKSQDNYNMFISGTKGKSTVFLELGVGYNTPGIIRYPFEAMVHNNPDAQLIRLNRDHMNGLTENVDSTISFNEDMTNVVNDMRFP